MTRNSRLIGLAVAAASLALLSGGIHAAFGAAPPSPAPVTLPELIEEALARNPEILAARNQWEAVKNTVPQARSLDDPTLQVQLWNVPGTFNVTQTQNSIFSLFQKFPFPGKLALKEDIASRSAAISEQALHARERNLIARLKQAYYDLFLADKAIQIHHEQIDLLKQYFESANARFRTGKGSQVDVLKAQVELSTLHQQLPVLEQRRDTARARLNTLLDRDPMFPVEPAQAPREVPLGKGVDELYRLAVIARPELKAAELAIQRNERSRALALRAYYPDFDLGLQRFQNYQFRDGFGAVVSINVPFAFWTKPKYDAAVQEAVAAVAVARADRHTIENLTRFQIQDLLAKVRASGNVADLFRTTVLPQAEQTLEAARAGYRTGKTDFLNLIEADRALRGFRLAYYGALVEREQRQAELEQVIGTEL